MFYYRSTNYFYVDYASCQKLSSWCAMYKAMINHDSFIFCNAV